MTRYLLALAALTAVGVLVGAVITLTADRDDYVHRTPSGEVWEPTTVSPQGVPTYVSDCLDRLEDVPAGTPVRCSSKGGRP